MSFIVTIFFFPVYYFFVFFVNFSKCSLKMVKTFSVTLPDMILSYSPFFIFARFCLYFWTFSQFYLLVFMQITENSCQSILVKVETRCYYFCRYCIQGITSITFIRKKGTFLMLNETQKHKLKHNWHRLQTSVKWVVFSILSGLIVGAVGTSFLFFDVLCHAASPEKSVAHLFASNRRYHDCRLLPAAS